ESQHSRQRRSGPHHHPRADIQQKQRGKDKCQPASEMRSNLRRAALGGQAFRAVPDAVPLRGALLAERLRARHADGERRSRRVIRASLCRCSGHFGLRCRVYRILVISTRSCNAAPITSAIAHSEGLLSRPVAEKGRWHRRSITSSRRREEDFFWSKKSECRRQKAEGRM